MLRGTEWHDVTLRNVAWRDLTYDARHYMTATMMIAIIKYNLFAYRLQIENF